MPITATLNDVAMPTLEKDFINTPLDKAVDIETLDNSLYTDFTDNSHSAWEFNYASLSEAQYNALRAIYDEQFTLYEYPTLSIPYYDVEDVPVRMMINPKSIIDNCGTVQGVQITFRETSQLPESS